MSSAICFNLDQSKTLSFGKVNNVSCRRDMTEKYFILNAL